MASNVRAITKAYEVGLGSGARASFRRKKLKKGKKSAAPTEKAFAELPETGAPIESWEIPRSKITDLRQIGEGNFGLVYIGQVAKGVFPGQATCKVAIKTLSAEANDEAVKDEFMGEATIMMAMSKCDNVVRLLGICTDKQPYYMVMEFMAKGDLKDVLVKNRPRSDRPAQFGRKRLALMGADVAEGMQYLATVPVVHRDLAARNCLVGEGYVVKVGDFGLTRKTYTSEYYRMKNATPLPIRWMAVESLNDGVFTTSTDLWSFGIVLWEIATFGKMPYAALDNEQVVDQVIDEEYRMPEPVGCPPGFHKIMMECWEEEAEDRGTFADKKEALLALAGKFSDAPITREVFHSNTGGDVPFADEADLSAYDKIEVGQDDDGYAVPVIAGGASGGGGKGDTLNSRAILGDGMDAASVCSWIRSVSGKKVDPRDLYASLKDGQTLCLLANKLTTGAVRSISSSKTDVKQRKNISNFLTAAAQYGVDEADLFDVDDLLEDNDPFRVLHCLIAYKIAADAK